MESRNPDARYFHIFASLIDSHDYSRPPRKQPRDGFVLNELAFALVEDGYLPGDQLINHPGPRERDEDGEPVLPDVNGLHKVAVPKTSQSTIVTGTRIVTHPHIECVERRGSWPAGTTLEHLLAEAWRSYFDLLTRTTASLKPELHDLLLPGFENRHHITFRQVVREGAEDANESEASLYRTLARKKYEGEPRTAAFLLHLRELWPGGPSYIGVFAPTGSAGVAWARALRTRHRDLLREPAFVMAEMSPQRIPVRATDLHWADGWDTRVILHHRL